MQTIQKGLAQTVNQNPKQNNYKSGKQQKKGNFEYDNRRNQNNGKSNQLYKSNDGQNIGRDRQYKGPDVKFENLNPSSVRKLQSSFSKKRRFGNQPDTEIQNWNERHGFIKSSRYSRWQSTCKNPHAPS